MQRLLHFQYEIESSALSLIESCYYSIYEDINPLAAEFFCYLQIGTDIIVYII